MWLIAFLFYQIYFFGYCLGYKCGIGYLLLTQDKNRFLWESQ